MVIRHPKMPIFEFCSDGLGAVHHPKRYHVARFYAGNYSCVSPGHLALFHKLGLRNRGDALRFHHGMEVGIGSYGNLEMCRLTFRKRGSFRRLWRGLYSSFWRKTGRDRSTSNGRKGTAEGFGLRRENQSRLRSRAANDWTTFWGAVLFTSFGQIRRDLACNARDRRDGSAPREIVHFVLPKYLISTHHPTENGIPKTPFRSLRLGKFGAFWPAMPPAAGTAALPGDGSLRCGEMPHFNPPPHGKRKTENAVLFTSFGRLART